MLGDFELRREIGRGGMGTVYEAWQRSLQRSVALKILASHVGLSDKAITRFQREAQAAAKLHHVNIVQIFAQGEIDGIHFYAMELVDGQGLNQLIAAYQRELGIESASEMAETVALPRDSQTGLPIVQAPSTSPARSSASSSSVALRAPKYATPDFFRLVGEHSAAVADALDYAHARGIVHRDIKPHNLLLGSDGRIQVSDFGLARLSEQPGVTVTGELVGSPLYMSPEQITGEFASVDHRTDIYSLGATMYEWLTLQPPYPGETRERVIGRILSSEAVAPRQQNPDIPVDLETIVLKAIERDPSRRYQHASELRDDLRRFLGQRRVLARRAGFVSRTIKLMRRHQVATVGVAAVVLATALGLSLWRSEKEAAKQRHVAQDTAAAFQEASAQAAEAQAKNEMLLKILTLAQANPETLAQLAGPLLGDAMAKTTGATQSLSGPGIGTSLSIAANLSTGLLSALAPPDAGATELSGDAAAALAEWGKGNFAGAKALLDQHLAEHPDDWNAVQLRAAVDIRMQKYDELIQDADRLVAVPEYSAVGQVWRGLAYLLGNDTRQSITSLTDATLVEGRHSKWAKVVRGLAYLQHGSPLDAGRDFDDVIRTAPDFLPAHLAMASLLYSASDFERARQSATRVIEADASNADAWTLRGDCNAKLGNGAAAAADYQQAIGIVGPSVALLTKLVAVQVPLAPTPAQPPAGAAGDSKALMPKSGEPSPSQSQSDAALDSLSSKPHLQSPRLSFSAQTLRDFRLRIP